MKNAAKRWREIDFSAALSNTAKGQDAISQAMKQGDYLLAHKRQLRLLKSFTASIVAVYLVTEKSQGKHSPGPDGIRSITDEEKWNMARELTIEHRPSPVRRKEIPKPGKSETRKLGIPNLKDRAHQQLLRLALEPAFEPKFADTMFGYRRGRGQADAITYIMSVLRKNPHYVLDADIQDFFGQIDHHALMSKVNAPDRIRHALWQILRAGVYTAQGTTPTTKGTPQGSPISPVLANLALAGLKGHIWQRFKEEFPGSPSSLKVILYADDCICAHPNREVIERCRIWMDEYLAEFGLNLSPTKTRIRHTLDKLEHSQAGFDYLGVHFQHFHRGKSRKLFFLAAPSKDAQWKLYQECKEIVSKTIISRKNRGTRRARQRAGMKDPVTIMIERLNRKLDGWFQYHSTHNSKKVFTKMDHKLFTLLWTWSKRTFKGKTKQWLIENLFSGVETDGQGNPLLRQDGTPRSRKWAFTGLSKPNDQPHLTLKKLADPPLRFHPALKLSKSYYDGDWLYWAQRRPYDYPAGKWIPNRAALCRQKGKCILCKQEFSLSDSLSDVPEGLAHTACIPSKMHT